MPVAGTCSELAHHHGTPSYRSRSPVTAAGEPAHRAGSSGRVRCRGHTLCGTCRVGVPHSLAERCAPPRVV